MNVIKLIENLFLMAKRQVKLQCGNQLLKSQIVRHKNEASSDDRKK